MERGNFELGGSEFTMESTPDFFPGDPSVTEAPRVTGTRDDGEADSKEGGYWGKQNFLLSDVELHQDY